jgi:hypothetical protein
VRRAENQSEISDPKTRRHTAEMPLKRTSEKSISSQQSSHLDGDHHEVVSKPASELLSDPRLAHPANAARKEHLIAFLQRRYGNAYLQEVANRHGMDHASDRARRDDRRSDSSSDGAASVPPTQRGNEPDGHAGSHETESLIPASDQKARSGRSDRRRSPSDSGHQRLETRGGGEVIQLTPEGRALAEELRAALQRGVASGTGAEYATLDRILVNRTTDQVDVYNEYTRLHGSGSLMRDLQAFVDAIPGTEEMRASMRDRWTARLYDAGIGEAQAGFQEARPVPVNAENERRWPGAWIAYFRSPEGSGHPHAQLALWVLARWNRIQAVEQIQRTGWMPPQNTEIRRASFGILSQQQTVYDEGIGNGNTYFRLIHSAFVAGLMRAVALARSYQQSYTAAHCPIPKGNGFRIGGGCSEAGTETSSSPPID